ncbi:MAG: lamin tail domain-containing protein [Patescibacteria group bacterium]
MPKHTSSVRPVLCGLLLGLLVLNPFFIPPAAADTTPTIVIGEVAWSGSSRSTSDEWLELWNVSDAPTSIGGWSLTGAGESGKTIVLPATSTIPAFGTFIISNYAANDPKSVVSTPIDVVTTTVSLSNSALGIKLFDASSNLVDQAGNGKTPPAGTSTPNDTSMVRLVPLEDGSTANAWTAATTSQNMITGTTDLGTPGVCDGCAAFMDQAPPVIVTSPTTITDPTITPPPVTVDATGTDVLSPQDVPTSTDATTTGSLIPPTEGTSTDTIPLVFDTTSTAPTGLPPVESTSSSDTANEILTTTSSTGGESTASVTTNTPAVVDAAIVPQTPTPQATSLPTSSPAPAPDYALLRLNEVSPNPAAGKEWVEIVSLDPTQTIPLAGCQLHDAQGRIYSFTDEAFVPGGPRYIVAELSSDHLNNSGDMAALYSPDGQLINSLTFGKTDKGDSWIRSPDITGDWTLTLTPTEGAANLLAQPSAPVTPTQPATATPTPITSSVENAQPTSTLAGDATTSLATTLILPEPVPSVPALVESVSSTLVAPTAKKPVATKKAASKTATKAPTKKISTASAAKTITPPLIPFTFDMLQNTTSTDIHVRLAGTVGSSPGLLTQHAFVLLSADGRGLLVSASTAKQLPAVGTNLSVTGSLRFNDANIPYLELSSKDTWTAEATGTSALPTPRTVDLTAPSTEDAWSFVQVTGTIDHVAGASFHLDLADAEVTVAVRPVVGYNVKQLIPGDVVTVSGLLNEATMDDLQILPRSGNEIVLVQHAPPTMTGTSGMSAPPSSPLSGWTPFAAAGGALALTEGAKQVQQRRKKKGLEKKLVKLSA